MTVKEDLSLQSTEFLNYFVTAAYEAFKVETGAELDKGAPTRDDSPFTSSDITVMFGIIGQVRGYISLSMSKNTAKKVAGAVLKHEVGDINQVTRAIYSIGEEISSRAGGYLSSKGIDCLATPPTVICGKGVKMSIPNLDKIAVNLNSELGSIILEAAFSA